MNREERLNLIPLFGEISRAAEENLMAERNQSKGTWKDLDRLTLYRKTCEEVEEMLEAGTREDAIREAGDVLAYLSMAVDAKGESWR